MTSLQSLFQYREGELLEKVKALEYRELQAIAKELKIPANGSKEHLKEEIIAKVRDQSGVKGFFSGLKSLVSGKPELHELQQATVAVLKEYLQKENLSTSGNKQELYERIRDFYQYTAKDEAKVAARHDKHVDQAEKAMANLKITTPDVNNGKGSGKSGNWIKQDFVDECKRQGLPNTGSVAE